MPGSSNTSDAAVRHEIGPRITLLLVGVLTGINLVNYLDRYLLPPILPQIRHQFALDAAQAGWLVSAFFIVYMLTALPVGRLADRWPRKWIIFIGVGLWSAATLLSGWAHSYGWLLAARMLVGIGEASYGCIVPAVIGDLYPARSRARVLSVFYAAIPVGAALGYVLGGYIAAHWGWRNVFYAGALPGLALSLAVLALPEPRRGAADQAAAAEPAPSLALDSGWTLYKNLLRQPLFMDATLGMAFSTFAMGALSVWVPSFLIQTRHMDPVRANNIFGIFTLANGIIATLIGGWLGDRWLRTRPGALYSISAWSLVLGTPIAAFSLFNPHPQVFLPAMCAGEFFLFLNGGPLNAAVVNSVPAPIRASALGLNLVLIHLLGDALSPTLVGWATDRTGSLAWGMALVLPVMLLGAAILFRGARRLDATRLAA